MSVDVVSVAPAIHSHPDGGYDARYFGLSPDGDNTASWDQDVVDWMVSTGGRLLFGPGVWTLPALTGERALCDAVHLEGVNRMATVLRLEDGSNQDFITNHQSLDESDPYGRFITLSHLTVDGNKANNSTGRGVYFSNPSPGDWLGSDVESDADNHGLLQNVWICNIAGDGFANKGGSEVRCLNVVVRAAGGHGFAPNYDSWLSDCTAQWCGGNGFLIAYGSIGLSNCKAFYNGAQTCSHESGCGMFIRSAGSTGGVVVTNFRAQDNGADGVSIQGGDGETGRHTSITGLLCDSNGWGNAGELAEPGTYQGLHMWSVQYTTVAGYHSFDRAVDHRAGSRVTQRSAIWLAAGSPGESHHVYVSGVHAGMTAEQDDQMGPAIARFDTTAVVNSSVTFNGETAYS